MTFCRIALATCFAAIPFAATAQTAPGDPIGGTWTGRIGQGINPNYAVTLELKANGADVTGTLVGAAQRGETRSGSYDATNGALRLEFVPAGSGATLTLEGIAVQGTAIGRVLVGSNAGTFVLTRSTGTTALPDVSNASIPRAGLRSAFLEVSGYVSKAAAMVPDDKYAFQPVSSVRTAGQLLGHIVDASLYYCGRASGRNVQWSDTTAQGRTDKATLIPRLQEAAALCESAHEQGNVAQLIVNLTHTNLHYGNLVTYLRLLGLVPPSSN